MSGRARAVVMTLLVVVLVVVGVVVLAYEGLVVASAVVDMLHTLARVLFRAD